MPRPFLRLRDPGIPKVTDCPSSPLGNTSEPRGRERGLGVLYPPELLELPRASAQPREPLWPHRQHLGDWAGLACASEGRKCHV